MEEQTNYHSDYAMIFVKIVMKLEILLMSKNVNLAYLNIPMIIGIILIKLTHQIVSH